LRKGVKRPSLGRILSELLSAGFNSREVARKLRVDEEVETALTILLSHGYVEKSSRPSSCAKCPFRDICGVSGGQRIYVITRKGVRLIKSLENEGMLSEASERDV